VLDDVLIDDVLIDVFMLIDDVRTETG